MKKRTKRILITLGIIVGLIVLLEWNSRSMADKGTEEKTTTTTTTTTTTETKPADYKITAKENAKKHPTAPGKNLSGPEFKGMPYYFKGEIVGQAQPADFDGKFVLYVKDANGYVMPIGGIFGEEPYSKGETIEVFGMLSGEKWKVPVDNIVGTTGFINAMESSKIK